MKTIRNLTNKLHWSQVKSDKKMKTNGGFKLSQLLSLAQQAGIVKPYFSLTFSLSVICIRQTASNC